jgi:hypothetical protein
MALPYIQQNHSVIMKNAECPAMHRLSEYGKLDLRKPKLLPI